MTEKNKMTEIYSVEGENGTSLIAKLFETPEGREIMITCKNGTGREQEVRYRNGREISREVYSIAIDNGFERFFREKMLGYKFGDLLDNKKTIKEIKGLPKGIFEQTSEYPNPFENIIEGSWAIYDKLGPELRKQIPPEWHDVLGKWLAPKEE